MDLFTISSYNRHGSAFLNLLRLVHRSGSMFHVCEVWHQTVHVLLSYWDMACYVNMAIIDYHLVKIHNRMTLGTGGSPGVDMVDATHEVGGGVGWGGDDNILCTCTHCWCYATSCFLHLHTWSVLRNIMFLALAHMVGATQHHGVGLGWGGVGMITFFAFAHMVGATQHHVPCTCTHGRCYATSCSLHLHTRSVLRNIMFWIKIALTFSDVW